MFKHLGKGIFFLIFSLVFLFAETTNVYADDIVVHADGSVFFVASQSNVLGDSTQKQSSLPNQMVPLVSPKIKSVIHISPTPTSDQKVNVTVLIGEQIATPPATPTSFRKIVDQVVALSADGRTILAIQPNNVHEVAITQGNTKAITMLPVEIDSQTHALQVLTSLAPVKISVLPQQAVRQVIDSGALSGSQAVHTNLSQQNGQLVYIIRGQKTGKLFGVISSASPVNVTLSAQTGKVIDISESLALRLFGSLLK